MGGTFTYLGLKKKSMINDGNSDRKSNGASRNGDTVCVKYNRTACSFQYNKWDFKRVRVMGFMTSANILDACAEADARPVCEHANYADGRCRLAGGAWHFAVYGYATRQLPDEDAIFKTRGAYFYAGQANNGLSIMSTGVQSPDHKWSRKNIDRDGDTFCVSRPPGFKAHTTWNKHHLERVPVEGQMTSENLLKACAKRKMRPVCNHVNDADGQCLIVSGSWHMSNPKVTPTKADQAGSYIPRFLLRGSFMYSGATHGGLAMLDMDKGHRVASLQDQDGDTLCSPTNYTNDKFEFNDYEFYRTKVNGYMTTDNIVEACANKSMRPVCDIGTVADGACRIAGGDDWRFSHPHDVLKKGLEQQKLKGAYFYSGHANGQMSSMNNGETHVWSKPKQDKNGDTFCVKRGTNFKSTFKWKNHTMERVQVNNVMTSSNILAACEAKGMRPVCNNAIYADGLCIIVGGEWHMSLEEHTKGKDLPRSLLRGTFTYCSDGNAGWSYLDTGTNHRWSRSTDKGGDTLCVRPDRQDRYFVKGEYQFSRVEVKDYMTAANILKTCQDLNMRPLCESKKYRDDWCRAIGGWHLSYPDEAKEHLPEFKVKGAYFYAGEKTNGGRTLMNNGVKHVWSKDKKDRNGDTFCVQHSSMVGHGECNCPSTNSLMLRAHQIKVLCEQKKAKAAGSGSGSGSGSGISGSGAGGSGMAKVSTSTRELGETMDDSEMRSHMATITKQAVPDKSLYLGETMHSSMKHLMSADCKKECGDVRGLVREIFEREKECGLLDIDIGEAMEQATTVDVLGLA